MAMNPVVKHPHGGAEEVTINTLVTLAPRRQKVGLTSTGCHRGQDAASAAKADNFELGSSNWCLPTEMEIVSFLSLQMRISRGRFMTMEFSLSTKMEIASPSHRVRVLPREDARSQS
ncbi:hypothetical protein ISN45_Aa08g004440 [Arabidopsis thaliana x Arabidopsis arenosa]|uniref:Uncharacterized protein n=1 Tax=Arabidopsis thaliana x Arabidopsis arenosa TaxID=1240361 RepID=A0A8T1XKH4_9BRAS|nr:hypothetical protein ISN45_Aa08g004440 [Arabidopsis thaliana x Arabidopsis arenosa]